MFDPFKDFESAGYLRNRFGEKDLDIVQNLEHELFRAGVDQAFAMLARRRTIGYGDFLEVHRILFEELYPWAGQDRAAVAPQVAVSKGSTWFCHPNDSRRFVGHGLSLARDKRRMRSRLGEIIGLFAYGHPFLDGNGRTMLIVHAELCHRAGFCVDWFRSEKDEYLARLSAEIETPGQRILDEYLDGLVVAAPAHEDWRSAIARLPGLEGSAARHRVEGEYSDAAVVERYRAFDEQRGYTGRE